MRTIQIAEPRISLLKQKNKTKNKGGNEEIETEKRRI
jgi:hypothetical protein